MDNLQLQKEKDRLQKDIEGLSAKRADIYRDIENEKNKSKADLLKQKKDIQDDIDKQYFELRSEKKQFEEYKDRLDKDLALRTKEVISKEAENRGISADLAKQKVDFEAYKIQSFKDKEADIERKNTALSGANQKLIDKQKELDKLSNYISNLLQEVENREFQVKYKEDQLTKQQDSLTSQQALFDKTLAEILKEKESVIAERGKLAESLAQIKKSTEDNTKLFNSINEDIKKNEDILGKIEKQREIQKSEARILSTQKDLQDEREQALNERQRLMDFKNRDIDSKTIVLRQLRDEIKKLDKNA